MNPSLVENRSGIPIGRIIATGLVAAILDAIAAMLVYQVQPGPLFKLIASGAFGKSAFTGGPEMLVAGVVFHVIIALGWAALYFFLYSRLRLYRINPIALIAGYGIFIWLMMNLVVLPLSNVSQRSIDAAGAMKGISILMIAVALPIVISAHAAKLRR